MPKYEYVCNDCECFITYEMSIPLYETFNMAICMNIGCPSFKEKNLRRVYTPPGIKIN